MAAAVSRPLRTTTGAIPRNNRFIDTGIPPSNDLESAILATLNPGLYTAVLSGNDGGTGAALVEIYDLSPNADSKLANISTRAFVNTGNDVVIGGFILGGGSASDSIIIRGIGPSLADFGLSPVVADPQLELRDSNGGIVRANNNWQDDPAQAAIISGVNLAPTNDLESAIAETLAPDSYTAVLFGTNNGTGLGLIEVYDNPQPGGPTPTPGPTGTPGSTPTPEPTGTPAKHQLRHQQHQHQHRVAVESAPKHSMAWLRRDCHLAGLRAIRTQVTDQCLPQ